MTWDEERIESEIRNAGLKSEKHTGFLSFTATAFSCWINPELHL